MNRQEYRVKANAIFKENNVVGLPLSQTAKTVTISHKAFVTCQEYLNEQGIDVIVSFYSFIGPEQDIRFALFSDIAKRLQDTIFGNDSKYFNPNRITWANSIFHVLARNELKQKQEKQEKLESSLMEY